MLIDDNGDYCEIVRSLFHITYGKRQGGDGRYNAFPQRITNADLSAHLFGETTFAFESSIRSDGRQPSKAKFAAFDVDQHFQERLPIFRDTIRELGLSSAAIVTGGSTSSRGKIIIVFVEPLKLDLTHLLIDMIMERAHGRAPQIVPPLSRNGDIETYPKSRKPNASPSVLRIAGCNAAKAGPMEQLCSLDCGELNLRSVVPLTPRRLNNIVRPRFLSSYENKPSRNILTLIEEPWPRSLGTTQVSTRLTRLANYCFENYGAGIGQGKYIQMLETVKKASAEFDFVSASGDKRNPLSRELEEFTFWGYALKKERWSARREDEQGYPKGYKALVSHAVKHELPKYCFTVDLGTLEQITGNSKSTVLAGMKRASDAGAVIVLHPGSPYRAETAGGLPAMYAVIGSGETADGVWERAAGHEGLRLRYRESPVLGYSDVTQFPFIPDTGLWETVKALNAMETAFAA